MRQTPRPRGTDVRDSICSFAFPPQAIANTWGRYKVDGDATRDSS